MLLLRFDILKIGKVQLFGRPFGGSVSMSVTLIGTATRAFESIPHKAMFQFYGGHNHLSCQDAQIWQK